MFLQRVANRGIRLGTLFERAAKRHPANLLVLDHDLDVAPDLGRRLTVSEVAELVADVASRLAAVNVRVGDYVVIHKSNSFDIPLLACAVARIGAIPVLLSSGLDGAVVAELVRRVRRPHLLTDQKKLDNDLPDSVFDLASQVVLVAGSDPRAVDLHSLVGVERVPAVPMPPEHPTLVTHTSGTTGTPKLAVHTGWTLQARYRPQASATAVVRRRRPLALHISFVHSRLFTAVALALLRGFPLIVLEDDDPDHVADLFTRLPPGAVEAHPNSFMLWEELADDPRQPFAGVKYFSSTFDAIHPRTVHRLLRASHRRVPVFGQLYGQSEVGPVVARAFTRRRSLDDDGRCVGMPFPGMTSVRVVSRDGRPATKQSPGHIEVHTDGRILTYLGEEERYRRQENGGWWRMGDVGYRTRWGCLHLLDREVDEIAGFGSTLAAEDALLARLGELAEVIIVPNEQGRPLPVVCTRNDRPLDMDAWRSAAATLPPMADPVQWKLADLPQTATVKIKRWELSRLLANGQGTSGPGSGT